jgi:hypothetical protein
MNAYGSEKRMCMALGVEHLDDVQNRSKSFLNYWLPKRRDH